MYYFLLFIILTIPFFVSLRSKIRKKLKIIISVFFFVIAAILCFCLYQQDAEKDRKLEELLEGKIENRYNEDINILFEEYRQSHGSLLFPPRSKKRLQTELDNIRNLSEADKVRAKRAFFGANAFMEEGDYKKALELCRNSISVVPTVEAHLLLAHVYIRMDSTKKAITSLSYCQQEKPNDASSYFILYIALTKDYQVYPALKACEKGVKLAPDHAWGHCLSAANYGMLFRCGRFIYEKVLNFKLDYTQDRYSLPPDYKVLTDVIQMALTEGIRFIPSEVERNLLASLIIRALNDEIFHYKEAIRLNPKIAEFHFRLASAYEEKNEKKNAISEYKLFLKLDPSTNKAQRIIKHIELLEDTIR